MSSSFGFGPVSKAAAIAGEIKRRLPQMETHFFGDRFTLRFAELSKAFDLLIEAEVDDSAQVKKIIPQLKNYDAVFSVLNLPLLPLWRKSFGSLYFVDSLVWMWREPPRGAENAEIYFVQDYLATPARIEKWSETLRIISVPPIGILPKHDYSLIPVNERKNRLLVNFSGCSNQYVNSKIYEIYVATLSKIIDDEASEKFEEIEICVNQTLAEQLKMRFSRSSVKIGFLPKPEFLQKLAESRFLLTAPGITTTLEAVALKTPLGFLLPQNDSQAVLSEIYRQQIGESLTMAFSRFNEKLAFPTSLDDFENLEQPIEAAVERMIFILENQQSKLKQFTAEMLNKSNDNALESLRSNIRQTWHQSGQKVIVEKVFGNPAVASNEF
ncbi:MAG: hypothetical protein LUM44_22425 [Pyrinomonadaceae bacterium]|nr:hypothetical protein [Pyrinomonadaceae bacterium]